MVSSPSWSFQEHQHDLFLARVGLCGVHLGEQNDSCIFNSSLGACISLLALLWTNSEWGQKFHESNINYLYGINYAHKIQYYSARDK